MSAMEESGSGSTEKAGGDFRESMTVEELSDWLLEQGIPDKYCKAFEDNYVDGNEFASLTSEEIRLMVPPLGLAKKIERLMPQREAEKSKATLDQSPPLFGSPKSPQSPPDTVSVASTSSLRTTSSATPSHLIDIPTHWRPETQHCMDIKVVSDEARNDVVRTLVTLLIAKYGSKPSRRQCEQASRALILQYPFLKDDLGPGYTSWTDKMLARVQNLIKADRKKSPSAGYPQSPKRHRKGTADLLLRRYPIIQHSTLEDQESIVQHKKAMREEMAKARPKEQVLLPLMKISHQNRWDFIRNEAQSVQEILKEYPALRRLAVLEQEIKLCLQRDDIKAAFLSEWGKFVPAIIRYCENSKKKTLLESAKVIDNTDDETRQISALKILATALSPKGSKDCLSFIYSECDISESLEVECVTPPVRNSPRLVARLGDSRQFFVILEQKVLCEAPSFQSALFAVISAYYVFHLEYPKVCRNVLFFLQDYVLGLPDSLYRPASYLATTSDIKRNIL